MPNSIYDERINDLIIEVLNKYCIRNFNDYAYGTNVTLYYPVIKDNKVTYREKVIEHFDPLLLAPSYYFASIEDIKPVIDEFNNNFNIDAIKQYLFLVY